MWNEKGKGNKKVNGRRHSAASFEKHTIGTCRCYAAVLLIEWRSSHPFKQADFHVSMKSSYLNGWLNRNTELKHQNVGIFWIAQNIKTTLTIPKSRGKITFVRWSRQRLRSGMQRSYGQIFWRIARFLNRWVWKIQIKLQRKNELQNQIKKLLTSLDGYGILLKLSREELLHNSKKEIKKLLTNMKHFDII